VRWIWDRGFPIKDASGEVYRVTGIAEDITERKRTEEALQQAHDSLALAQRASASGLWDWHIDPAAAYVSPEFRELYGFGPDTVVDYATWIVTVHPEDRARMARRIREALKRHEDWNEEFRMVHPTLTSTPWRASKAFARWHQGHCGCEYISTCAGITGLLSPPGR
jgi:PAS domain S-box-containing protein